MADDLETSEMNTTPTITEVEHRRRRKKHSVLSSAPLSLAMGTNSSEINTTPAITEAGHKRKRRREKHPDLSSAPLSSAMGTISRESRVAAEWKRRKERYIRRFELGREQREKEEAIRQNIFKKQVDEVMTINKDKEYYKLMTKELMMTMSKKFGEKDIEEVILKTKHTHKEWEEDKTNHKYKEWKDSHSTKTIPNSEAVKPKKDYHTSRPRGIA